MNAIPGTDANAPLPSSRRANSVRIRSTSSKGSQHVVRSSWRRSVMAMLIAPVRRRTRRCSRRLRAEDPTNAWFPHDAAGEQVGQMGTGLAMVRPGREVVLSDTARVEAFSDAVLAIVITLLVLDLR